MAQRFSLECASHASRALSLACPEAYKIALAGFGETKWDFAWAVE
jgi:hypothetical protein